MKRASFTIDDANDFIERSLNLLEPVVVAYAGKVPVYDKYLAEVCNRHGGNESDCIFSVNSEERPYFEFYRLGIEKRVVERLSNETKRNYAIGDWTQSLIHDIFHVYQRDFCSKNGIAGCDMDYGIWREGLAELLSWDVCLKMYPETSSMGDPKSDGLKDVLEFAIGSLEKKELKEGIEQRLGMLGASYSLLLGRDIAELLPFELPAAIKKSVEDWKLKIGDKKITDYESYAVGLAYLGMFAKENGLKPMDLLKIPVPDSIVKNKLGVC